MLPFLTENMLGNFPEVLGKLVVLYRRLWRLIDLRSVPIVVIGVNEEFFGGSTNEKSFGQGFPDLDKITKLAKSPERENIH